MLRKFIWTIFFALIISGISVDAFSEQLPAASTANVSNPPTQNQTAAPADILPDASGIKKSQAAVVKKSSVHKGQVSLNFEDADINAVMQTVLGNLLKVNYLIDPRVKGNITFRSIKPVPQEEILPVIEAILHINGIAIVENNGIYRVIPLNDVSKETASVRFGRNPDAVDMTGKAIIQVVQINHGTSSELARVLTPFVSANAVSVDIPKNNQLVLVDTPANIKRLLALINILDSDDLKKKKSPRVFVYNVQNSKAKDIVIILHQIFTGKNFGDAFAQRLMEEQQQQQQQQQGEQPPEQPPIALTLGGRQGGSAVISELTKIFYDELTNTIIILGTDDDYKVIADTIKTIDVLPRQVMIEGAVAQISLTDSMTMGFSWQLNTSISNLGLKLGINTKVLDSSYKSFEEKAKTGFTIVGTDSTGTIQAVIQALANDSKAKLLASPHILVSDNKEARIQVGQSVPIITSETIATQGTVPQRTIQYKDIGIILKVKPRINDSGLVTMDITQEISSYTTVKLYADEDQIILKKTEAMTSLVVQDGQTIVIGGLIQEDKSDSNTGLPYLSKIPIIGFLFGETSKKKERSEIIVLLTPRVLKNPQQAVDLTSRYVEKFTGTGASQDIKKDELIKNDSSDELIK